jgi:hypothetical protein
LLRKSHPPIVGEVIRRSFRRAALASLAKGASAKNETGSAVRPTASDCQSWSNLWRAARAPSLRLNPTKRRVRVARSIALLGVAMATSACTTIDPGPNFVVPDERFDADYFFCHVEPEVLFAKSCGPGDRAAGDGAGSCHFSASAVSGMALVDHPSVACGGGDRPVDRSQIGTGSAAQANLQAATLVMSRDYLTAPIYVRPTGSNHPRVVFAKDDSSVDILKTWAQKP